MLGSSWRTLSKAFRPAAAKPVAVIVFGAAGLWLGITIAASSARAGAAVAFAPSDDTYASAATPSSLHGSLTYVSADASPVRRGYLKFRVEGVPGPVTKATLRLWTLSASSAGVRVSAVADTSWRESTLTYTNAPALAPVATAASGSFSSGTWLALDVSPLVKGDGTYSFALTTASTSSLRIASKERGASYAPRLMLELGSSSTTSATTTGATTTTPPPGPTPPPGSVTLPARAAFYYPWYPETWTVNGAHVFYSPTLGYYDSSSAAVVDEHVRALDYAKVKVAIASWWGVGKQKESFRIPLLLERTAALSSPLKWSLYYEKEGSGNPSVAELQADLLYIRTNYASWPGYAYVNGKPVVFVYNAGDGTCEVADRWKQAAGDAWYVVLKVFSGYRTCPNQPSSWHQYGPASAVNYQSGYSFAISPGFWRADEASPRLGRDLSRWQQNVRDMVTSNAPWQLITTFNEWGEGTAIESATQWASPPYGDYLAALATDGQ